MEKTDTETTTGETMKIQMGRRQGRAIALGVLSLALGGGACGGGGDDEQTPQAADKADSTETAEAEATEQKKVEEAEAAEAEAEAEAEAAAAEAEAEAEAAEVKKTCYVAPNADCS